MTTTAVTPPDERFFADEGDGVGGESCSTLLFVAVTGGVAAMAAVAATAATAAVPLFWQAPSPGWQWVGPMQALPA